MLTGEPQDVAWLISCFKSNYEIKEADLEDFLSFRIKRETDCISLDCEDYARATLRDMGMEHCNISKTPLPMKANLKPAERDSELLAPEFEYKKYLGKLLWIAKTRPDLSYAANVLSRVSHRPTYEAWHCMKRTFRYLAGTLDHRLRFRPTKSNKLIAFSDASFAEDYSHRSHGGTYIYVAGGMIQHYSRIQRHVATSTAEAELVELFRTSNEVSFIQGLAADIGLQISSSTVYTDALTVLNMIRSQNLLRRSKHMATKIVKLQELEHNRVMYFGKVHTSENLADLTTKQLTFEKHAKLSSKVFSFTCDVAVSRRPDGNLPMTERAHTQRPVLARAPPLSPKLSWRNPPRLTQARRPSDNWVTPRKTQDRKYKKAFDNKSYVRHRIN